MSTYNTLVGLQPSHNYDFTGSTPQVEKSQFVLGIRSREQSQTHPQKQLIPKRRATSHILKNLWLWEIAAIAFSLACIAAVIGVLIYEDGRQLANWHLIIAPNAVISFLATISKASFLVALTEIISQLKWLHFQRSPQLLSDLNVFDQASRGPWGAVKLSMFKHKNTLLATWAALIMLAALLVDPALQLVFSFPSRLAPVQESAPLFQSTQEYDPTWSRQIISSAHFNNPGWAGKGSASVNPGMQAAIIDGFNANHSIPRTSCQANHCSWNATTTLAVCGSCEDLTDQVQKTCIDSQINEVSSPQTVCTYDFGNGITLESTNTSSYWTKWNSTAVQIYRQYINSPELGGPPAPSKATLSVFGAVRLFDPVNGVSPPGQVMMCGFNMCAKTFDDISEVNGTSAAVMTQQVGLNTSFSELFCRAPNGTVSAGECVDYGTRNQYLIPEEDKLSTVNKTFAMNVADFANIALYLTELFTVSWDSLNNFDRNVGVTQSPYGSATPMVGDLLFQSPNVNDTIRAVSNSMTENIRLSPNATANMGTALTMTTFIKVKWEWLALPLTLLAMTMILLVIVIVLTHKQKVVVWKSSSLAMLFHDTEGWNIPPGSVSDRTQLEQLAKEMKGQLRDDLSRPAFVKSV